eukprot:CAMPEP_0202085696 /NCGR_PEP_ID=MMETSP0964-20121228/31509_1 /ASSEMBLY_ACC=CAM_ASM_000500 /TAXON_ID=4773 /ORGANISM="Schizochytrium aggregatum, Strain ATCC28209" /LENGTH=42 /DNA_ID= /DNA_START= /DNA_END= /DNA_ORIENTATION=
MVREQAVLAGHPANEAVRHGHIRAENRCQVRPVPRWQNRKAE